MPDMKADIAELFKKKATIDELVMLENSCEDTYVKNINYENFQAKLKET